MLKQKTSDRLEELAIKIYEGLYKQVKEDNSMSEEDKIEDIENKIDIIMDALGLETEDKEEDKEENNDVNVDIDVQDDNEDEEDTFEIPNEEENAEEPAEESLMIGESVDNEKENKYKVEILDNADLDYAGAYNAQQFNYFDTLDEVVDFLQKIGALTDRAKANIVENDNIKSRGLIYIGRDYEVTKN